VLGSERRLPADGHRGSIEAGIDDRRSILLTEHDWELANGVAYFEKEIGSRVASARLSDYVAIAGLVGRPPLLVAAGNTPFRQMSTSVAFR
jgi:hypothetical protein